MASPVCGSAAAGPAAPREPPACPAPNRSVVLWPTQQNRLGLTSPNISDAIAMWLMTENGIAAASPVIVGEKRGGPIFRLLAGQKTGALPEAVKRLGKIFADLSHMNIRRKGAEKKQR